MKTGYLRTAAVSLMLGLCCASPLRADDNYVTLNLTCYGSGVATRTESTNISRYDPKTKKYSTTNAQYTSKEPFEGTAVIEISGDTGRIKVPEPLVPALNTRSDGWFAIRELVVTSGFHYRKGQAQFSQQQAFAYRPPPGLLTLDGSSGNFPASAKPLTGSRRESSEREMPAGLKIVPGNGCDFC